MGMLGLTTWMANIGQAAEGGGASEYVQHHLTHNKVSIGDGASFWHVHLDSLVMSIGLGMLTMLLFWLVARKATAGVPGKLQAFIELVVEFIDNQVKDVFHKNRRYVAPIALTIFVWVVMMNAMDFIPLELLPFASKVAGHDPSHVYWRLVPTADINITLAMSLTVFILMIITSVVYKGVGGFLHELIAAPFGDKIWLAPINLAMNAVEYLSKVASLALRLFGNMYAGELVFMLIALLAGAGAHFLFADGMAVKAGGALAYLGSILAGAGWAIFHVLIVLLQGFIFMILTTVYLSISAEDH
jgi:F-type H+-transporting ATPase subunit a